ncbi:MAG: hypothetical protein RIR10_955, partial [Planctomycetota bacterium]
RKVAARVANRTDGACRRAIDDDTAIVRTTYVERVHRRIAFAERQSPMTTPHQHLILLGGGGHAAVVAEAARRAGHTIVAIAARDEPMRGATAHDPFQLVRWLGDPDTHAGAAHIREAIEQGARVIIAVGHVELRAQWANAFAEAVADAIVDPLASVSPSATLERGAFVAAGAIVQARAVIGAHVIINTRAVVEHDSVIGARAHIAPGAILCGGVVVGEDALIGAGAVVLPNIRIGANAVVGAGSVVTASVVDRGTVRGVPARA